MVSFFQLLMAGFVGLSIFFALEADATPRGRAQRHRIQEGARSGELTRGEAQGLRKEQRGIRQERREMMKDGSLSKDDRAKLRQDRNEASKHIYQEKHDGETRGGADVPTTTPSE